MNPNKSTALRSLLSGVQASFSMDENGNITNWESDTVQPTDAEIQTKLDELQADYDAKQYQRDRQQEYPNIGDQLDMLWHAIDAGTLDTTSDFYTTLAAVKNDNPKPE